MVAYTVEVVKDVVEVLVVGEDSLSVADGEALPVTDDDCPSVAVTGQTVV